MLWSWLVVAGRGEWPSVGGISLAGLGDDEVRDIGKRWTTKENGREGMENDEK